MRYIARGAGGIAQDRYVLPELKDDYLSGQSNDNDACNVLNNNRLFEHIYSTYIIDSLYHCKDVKPHKRDL